MAIVHRDCNGPKSDNAKDAAFLKSASPVVKEIENLLSGKSEASLFVSISGLFESLAISAKTDGSYDLRYTWGKASGAENELLDIAVRPSLEVTVGKDGSIKNWQPDNSALNNLWLNKFLIQNF